MQPPLLLESHVVGEVGGSCGLVCGYTSKIVYVTEDSCSLAVELPCDEVSDILAVSCCLTKAKGEAYVGVISHLKVEANQSPVSRVQGKLPVGPSHVH